MKYEKILEPFKLGQMELKNRIVMPAVAVSFAGSDGSVTQRMIDYLEERARGGVGLIIVGLASVDFARGRIFANNLAIDDDKYIPGYRKLVETLHGHGAKVALQLHHGGGFSLSALTGSLPVAPSSVFCRAGGNLPHELTIEEIHGLVQRFAAAAERAVKAGFDGIEIHAGGNYLFHQFLSLSKNKRRDEYGGELKNRARFLLEVMSAIHEKAGADCHLWIKINGVEYGKGQAWTTDEAVELAQMLQKAGSTAIRVSSVGPNYPYVKTEEPDGSNMHLAAAIKKAIDIPVIALGRITPSAGESALLEGKADLVVIGRGLLSDPELPNKLASGRSEDIAPCITCLNCSRLTPSGDTTCLVNPALGREAEYRIKPADRSKRVLVIGGGPAGMEAARVAALRGHQVTLYEKGQRLGGRMRWAWRVPGASRIEDLTLHLARQVKKAGVTLEYGKTLMLADIEALKPDAVILATGCSLSLARRLLAFGIIFLSFLAIRKAVDRGMAMRSHTRRRQVIGIQTPLLAAAKSNQGLISLLRGRVPEIFLAGDCLEPAGILEAVADGAMIGRCL